MNLYYAVELILNVTLADLPVDQAMALDMPTVTVDDPTVLTATKQVVNGAMQLSIKPQPGQTGKTATVTVTGPDGTMTTYPFTIVGGTATLDLASASYVSMA